MNRSLNLNNGKMNEKKIRKNYSRRLFTNEEDEKLLKLVEKYKQNWNLISKEMKDRNIRQCKERYYHYLSPNIKRSEWNSEEDIKLIKLIEEHGKKWKILENYFSGRTEIDIRNRFYVLVRNISKNIRKQIRSNSIQNIPFNSCSQNLTIHPNSPQESPNDQINVEKQEDSENEKKNNLPKYDLIDKSCNFSFVNLDVNIDDDFEQNIFDFSFDDPFEEYFYNSTNQ